LWLAGKNDRLCEVCIRFERQSGKKMTEKDNPNSGVIDFNFACGGFWFWDNGGCQSSVSQEDIL